MENETKVDEWMTSISEFLLGQAWFQQLKAKWEELDPQSQLYVKIVVTGGTVIGLLFIALSAIWSVSSLKSDIAEKTALLRMIQSGNDEIHRLRDITANKTVTANEAPWPNYFETIAATAGIDKTSLTVTENKIPNQDKSSKNTPAQGETKESLFEVGIKHANIRQIVRYAFELENGQRPTKLRNLSIDTKNDPSGYLDATMNISGFTLASK